MTKNQFKNLKVGDAVLLPWSSEPNQIVVEINDEVVDTKIADFDGDVSYISATYSNNYKDILLPGGDMVKVPRTILQRVYNIAKNATRIVKDWSWGDVYPEEVEEPIFPKDLVDALGEALEK